MMARRAGDFRLDSRLVLLCAEDIKSTCGTQVEHMTSVEGSDGRVLQCLQDFRDELKVCLPVDPAGNGSCAVCRSDITPVSKGV